MRMVDADADSVEVQLRAGQIKCLDCEGKLRPWGFGRERTLRDREERVQLRPRRSICRTCSEIRGRLTTHVLLPTLALLRRADVAKVIGEALSASIEERMSRREAASWARVPVDTLRGWRRRFRERAEAIRVQFTELAHEWDPELGGIRAQETAELDALEAIGLAVSAAGRHFRPQPPWQVVAAASGGRLLSNTSRPLPNSE